jgi:hypothetical protein
MIGRSDEGTNFMGKVFHGPFRITGADISIGRDGDVFIYLRDDKNNVIGTVLETEKVIQLSQSLEAAALQAVLSPGAIPPTGLCRISVE